MCRPALRCVRPHSSRSGFDRPSLFSFIGNSPRQWAHEIERVRCMANRRTGYYQQIADAGYDIAQNAKWLQKLLLKTMGQNKIETKKKDADHLHADI